MRLYLVQHGEARPEAEDPERHLSEKGRRDAERIAAWAGRVALAVDEIRHSGKARARETAEILGAALRPPEGVHVAAGLAPLDDVEPLAEGLAQESGSLMLVGHLPFLARLAGRLLAGDPGCELLRFRQGGIVCLERGEAGWQLLWAVWPELVP